MNKFSIHEGGGGVPLKLWDSHQPFEAGAMQQLRNVASLPFVHSHIAGMPDVHWGKGTRTFRRKGMCPFSNLPVFSDYDCPAHAIALRPVLEP